jgi:hypothetical protein
MIQNGGEKLPSRGDTSATPSDDLPFSIELWNVENSAVERVLARAFSAELARAIFKAATSEHPARRITLRRGERVISDTAA